MEKINRFTIFVLIIFVIFTIGLALAGYFQIGLLSDDYFNINGSIHSTLADKLTGNLPFTNTYHLRTTFYMSMESSNYLHNLLSYSYDDFLLYRIQNLLLYLILAYIAGRIMLLITEHLSVAVLTSLTIIIFPNNINNICWVAARVELLCGIFFLISLYYAFKYVKEGNQTAFVSCLIAFIAALLTKEISITIPLITVILIYAFYGKEMLLKNKMIIIIQFALLLLYVFYKVIILGNNVGEMLTLYQASPLSNAPGILARAAIALSVPMDYLTLNISLRDKDPFLMLYLASLYGALFYLISVMVRNEIYKYIGYMALTAVILLLPNIYIGYIRTQMILVPFIILAILLYWTYDHQIKNSIHFNKLLLKGFFTVALCFWCYWSYSNVTDWAYSYTKGKQEMTELINTHIDEGKRTIIIGNPGRYRQAFLFDKLTGAYNYWKNKEFVIKDTINDIVQTGALDEVSLSARLNYKETQPGEFEISTTGGSQYFYIEGYDNEKIKEGFKNREMSVEFMEYNILNKPTKLKLKMLTSQIKCFLCSEFKFIKLY